MPEETIYFYHLNEPYGSFSNFSHHDVRIKGKKWRTSEHYFQAQKFAGTKREEEIRLAASPKEAAEMGNSREFPLREDWEDVKEEIMLEALRAKFSQHEELKNLLLSTRDNTLVEHTKNDRYWADGGDGSGKNRLGILLMQVREELRNLS